MSRPIDALDAKEKAELVQEVLDKKTGVNDTDWCDIVMGYDLDCSPDTLRKAGVGIKLASDAGMRFPTDGDGARAATDGYVERQKLYDLRRSIQKDLREQSRSELLRETIREAVLSLPPIRLPSVRPASEPDKRNRELVVGIGDFHYGARFTVRGLYEEVINEYDSIVFETRMVRLAEQIAFACKIFPPDIVHIMIVGDMLDGLLRSSQISRLEYGVVDSAIYLSEFLCQWLADLSEALGIPIAVYAVRGNHGEIRPLGSKAGQFPEENMERIVMHYLCERFKNCQAVLVLDGDAPMSRMVEVVGYKFLMIHGQDADIESITRDHQNLYHNKIDVVMCGHLHKSQTFTSGINPEGNALIERVPSICGIDPYAQSKGYGAPAGATLIVMERGYGRRCVFPVRLS